MPYESIASVCTIEHSSLTIAPRPYHHVFAAAEMEDRAYCIVCQVFYAVLSVALSAAFSIFSKILLNWGWNAASP